MQTVSNTIYCITAGIFCLRPVLLFLLPKSLATYSFISGDHLQRYCSYICELNLTKGAMRHTNVGKDAWRWVKQPSGRMHYLPVYWSPHCILSMNTRLPKPPVHLLNHYSKMLQPLCSFPAKATQHCRMLNNHILPHRHSKDSTQSQHCSWTSSRTWLRWRLPNNQHSPYICYLALCTILQGLTTLPVPFFGFFFSLSRVYLYIHPL